MISVNSDIDFKKIYSVAKNNNIIIALDGSGKDASYKKHSYSNVSVIKVPSFVFKLWIKNKKKEEQWLAKLIVHEFGHFIVAPKSRKYKKDYGIPAKTNSFPSYWDIEEWKAQLVEIKLCELLNIKPFRSHDSVCRLVNRRVSKKRFWAKKWWRESGEKLTIEFFKKKTVRRKFS